MIFRLYLTLVMSLCCEQVLGRTLDTRRNNFQQDYTNYDDYGDFDDFNQLQMPQDIVGSNLFWNFKKCFSPEDVSLLTLRMTFEGLIPVKNITKLENDRSIEVFLDYVAGTMKIIQRNAKSEMFPVVQMSYLDAMGGYLHYKLLPIAKFSFYSGTVSNKNVQTLLELNQFCRSVLNTDGNNWKRPITIPKSVEMEIEPLKIVPDNHLMSKELEEPTPCLSLLSNDHSDVIVPMPRVLDSRELQSVYFPFRKQQVFDMRSESSAFIFLQYYVAATKCYCFQQIPPDGFEQELSYWIAKYVVPYLNDDCFYPGLGGVWRIIASLKQSSSDKNQFDWDGHYPMPHIKSKPPTGFIEKFLQETTGPVETTSKQYTRNIVYLILVIILAILMLIGIIGLMVKGYRIFKKRKDEYINGRKERTLDKKDGKYLKRQQFDEGLAQPASSSVQSGSWDKLDRYKPNHKKTPLKVTHKEYNTTGQKSNDTTPESSTDTSPNCFSFKKKHRKDKLCSNEKGLCSRLKRRSNERTHLNQVSEESYTSSSESVILEVDELLKAVRKDINENQPKGGGQSGPKLLISAV